MGTPANSLNLTTAGIMRFDGVSVFSGIPVTLNRVLIGAASNGITSLGAGLTNQVLNGNTGSAPSFGAVPAGALPGSGQITLSNGTNVSVTGSPVALGGTATINVAGPPSATTLTNHGVVIGQATSAVVATAAGSAGQVLQSGGASADPAYSTATYPAVATGTGTILRADGTNWVATTATYPATTTVSQILYSSATSVISGLATGNNGLLVTGNTGIPAILAGPGTTGNILQSNAAAAPSFSTTTYPSTAGTSGKVLISDGTNIVSSTPTFPNASATIRKIIVSDGTNWVASTETYAVPGTSGNILTSDGTNWTSATPSSGGLTWSVITANQSAVAANGYICNKASALVLTLPASGAIGDIIEVTGTNTALGWSIAQNANQQIFIGTSSTTVGAGGSISSINIRDSVKLVCVVAGASTVWNIVSSIGNFTIV
jgi:hypothetical protein